MRLLPLLLTGCIGILVLGCQDNIISHQAGDDGLLAAESHAKPSTPGAQVLNFVAVLDGSQEVHEVQTRARGNARFQLSKDGMELRYVVNVANISNVTMAHIHLGARGQNGPVVAWLYPSQAPAVLIPGRLNGRLAEGVIRAEDLLNTLLDQTLADLIAHMRAGNAYVNVHTTAYPPGEIRGQIDRGNGAR
jgi:hypothetical protein